MDDEEGKIETEVAKFASSASSEVDACSDAEQRRKKKKAKKTKMTKMTSVEVEITADTEPLPADLAKELIQLVLTPENLDAIGAQVDADSMWVKMDRVKVLNALEAQGDTTGLKDTLASIDSEFISARKDSTVKDGLTWKLALTDEVRIATEQEIEENKRLKDQLQSGTIELTAKPWVSLGSELEIQQSQAVCSRPLIEIEIEATPERMSKSLKLQDSQLSYVSMGPARQEFKGIRRKSIDGQVQAVPQLKSVNSQTDPGLPVNAWTQYVYDLEEATAKTASRDLPPDFTFKEINYLENALDYNETLNLYTNDYPLLVVRSEDGVIPSTSSLEPCESFVDVKHCASKMPGIIDWHPMWSGVVAVSYVNCHRALSVTVKPKIPEFERHYILIWCVEDALRPRLILVGPREVCHMAWCPTDPNILAAIVEGGQLVLWDVTGRLEAVERKEVLSRDQQRFRVAIRSLISWSQPLEDLKYVHPCVVSSSSLSHQAAGTALFWLSPYHMLNATGHWSQMPEGKYSMQLMSSGEGGYVLVWDLQPAPDPKAPKTKKKTIVPGQKFSDLDKVLKPVYRIMTKKAGVMFTSLTGEQTSVNYVRTGPARTTRHTTINVEDPEEELEDSDNPEAANAETASRSNEEMISISSHKREIYIPELNPTKNAPVSEIHAGSEHGDVMKLKWEGIDFDSGDDLVTETAEFITLTSGVHDGPVISTRKNPFLNQLLVTVGGHVFAIWSDTYKSKPILWKTRPARLSQAYWSLDRRSLFMVLRVDGVLEIWDLLLRTDRPIVEQTVSGEALTAVDAHSLPLKVGRVISIADKFSIKLFALPNQFTKENPNDADSFTEWVNREVHLQVSYADWNRKYSATNKAIIDKRKSQKSQAGVANTTEEKVRVTLAEDKAKIKKRNKLLNLTDVAASRIKTEQENMLNHLLRSKNLEKEELLQKQQPLILMKKMEEEKKMKQKKKMSEQEAQYKQTVARLFPDVVETDDVEDMTEILKIVEEIRGMEDTFMDEYEKLHVKASAKKIFDRKMDFRQEIEEAARRRELLDVPLYLDHERRTRYEVRKTQRAGTTVYVPPPLACFSKTPSLALSRDLPLRSTLDGSNGSRSILEGDGA